MEKYIEQLTPLFSKVAEKIGEGATFGWEVALRQQIAYGLVLALLSIVGIAGIIIGIWVIKLGHKHDWYEEDAPGVVIIILSALTFISCSVNAVLRLYNPAYYALQFFINLVK